MARFALVLHAHLPYVRAHGMWPFGEETLYEAMAETYLPLLRVLERLHAEGVEARFTLGITPILAEQLADARVREGFLVYARDRLERAQRDYLRYRGTGLEKSARHQVAFFELTLDHFHHLGGDLLAPFRRAQERGQIELLTSNATHGYSPLLATRRPSGPRSRPGWPPTAATSPRIPWASGFPRWPTGLKASGSPRWRALPKALGPGWTSF